jgi:hypothetical protein
VIQVWCVLKSLSLPNGKVLQLDGNVIDDPMVLTKEKRNLRNLTDFVRMILSRH